MITPSPNHKRELQRWYTRVGESLHMVYHSRIVLEDEEEGDPGFNLDMIAGGMCINVALAVRSDGEVFIGTSQVHNDGDFKGAEDFPRRLGYVIATGRALHRLYRSLLNPDQKGSFRVDLSQQGLYGLLKDETYQVVEGMIAKHRVIFTRQR